MYCIHSTNRSLESIENTSTTKTILWYFCHWHTKKYIWIIWIVQKCSPCPSNKSIFTTTSICWISLSNTSQWFLNQNWTKLTKKRNGSLGISCKLMPKLPAPTANIDVNATKLSCGWGILQLNWSIYLVKFRILTDW